MEMIDNTNNDNDDVVCLKYDTLSGTFTRIKSITLHCIINFIMHLQAIRSNSSCNRSILVVLITID